MSHRFRATLIGRGPQSAWTFLPIPLDIPAAFGTTGRVPVRGTINGFPFQNSLKPEGDGTHTMMVNKELRDGAKALAGDTVDVVLERDLSERVVIIPAELEEALSDANDAREAFTSFSYSHRKEFADWVGAAKKSETRIARARKTVQMLRAGKRSGDSAQASPSRSRQRVT